MNMSPARIAGRDVVASESIEVRSPFDGRLVGQVPACSASDIDEAMAAAAAAHARGPRPAHERAEVLDRASDLLRLRAEVFASTLSEEAAKPITAAMVEVTRARDTFRHAAAAARTLTGDVLPLDASPSGEGFLGLSLRVPRGPVAALTPFNFPLNLAVHKVAPAIAAGCPFVLKPSPRTPLTAILLGELLVDAGLDEDGWSVLTCTDDVVGALVEDPRVAVLSFTGSARVGWSFPGRAPRSRVLLELGDATPVVVDRDVDVPAVAAAVARGGYSYAGQTCIAVQRCSVHVDIYDDFVAALSDCAEALVAGDPADRRTDLSSLITPRATDRVSGMITDAISRGARVATGATTTDEGVLRPTVLADVDHPMQVCTEEAFGPLIGVRSHASLDEGLSFASQQGGLQIGIFSTDVQAVLARAPRLPFGGVLVNQVPTFRTDGMPYGGTGASGNTREGPRWAVDEMTESRLIVLPLT